MCRSRSALIVIERSAASPASSSSRHVVRCPQSVVSGHWIRRAPVTQVSFSVTHNSFRTVVENVGASFTSLTVTHHVLHPSRRTRRVGCRHHDRVRFVDRQCRPPSCPHSDDGIQCPPSSDLARPGVDLRTAWPDPAVAGATSSYCVGVWHAPGKPVQQSRVVVLGRYRLAYVRALHVLVHRARVHLGSLGPLVCRRSFEPTVVQIGEGWPGVGRRPLLHSVLSHHRRRLARDRTCPRTSPSR